MINLMINIIIYIYIYIYIYILRIGSVSLCIVKGKVKQYRNRPGVAQRVPGGLGSQISMTCKVKQPLTGPVWPRGFQEI